MKITIINSNYFSLISIFMFSMAIKSSFIFVFDGSYHPEVISYTLKSMHLDPNSIYLGSPAFGGGWLIPSFLFYPINFLIINYFGHLSLLLSIAALNSIGIMFLFLILLEISPNKKLPALITGFLASLIPLSIFLSTAIWNPSYIFPLSMISLYYLILWVKNKQSRYLILTSLFLNFLCQYHLIGYFLLPLLPIIFILYRPKITRLSFFLALFPWLALAGGYLYFDSLHQFNNLKMIFQQGKGGSANVIVQNFAAFFSIIESATTRPLVLFEDLASDYINKYFFISWIPIVFYSLEIFYIVIAIYYYTKKIITQLKEKSFKKWIQEKPVLTIILLWVFFPVVIFFIIHKTYVTRYAIIIYALVVALQVFFFFRISQLIKQSKNNYLRAIQYLAFINLLFIIYTVCSIYLYSKYYIYQDSITTSGSIYNTILAISKDLPSNGYPILKHHPSIKENHESQKLINSVNNYFKENILKDNKNKYYYFYHNKNLSNSKLILEYRKIVIMKI